MAFGRLPPAESGFFQLHFPDDRFRTPGWARRGHAGLRGGAVAAGPMTSPTGPRLPDTAEEG